MKNSEWKDAFIRRFAQLLNTAFAPERVLGLIEELYGYVEPEIAREREKFNQSTFMGEQQPAENLAATIPSSGRSKASKPLPRSGPPPYAARSKRNLACRILICRRYSANEADPSAPIPA